MDFDFEKDLPIFAPILARRPEISAERLRADLKRYFLPFVEKLVSIKQKKSSSDGVIVGVSAIQGAGKTTQGEILEVLLDHLGFFTVSMSIDDHYITHTQLQELREKDPRYIRRGVTHDIPLAISDLVKLKTMESGDIVFVTQYDKGAFNGDGDRGKPREVTQKPDFIFYDGWMLGAGRVVEESVFSSGLPALETPEAQQFAKDVNKKLDEYLPLWDMIEFMNVLYVPNYQVSLQWRDQAEDVLRAMGHGMSHEQIKEFVYYFWRSVHPAIQIKNLAHDSTHAQQVVVIGDDHSIGEVLTAEEASKEYP